jgi:hypothetical protein
VSGHGKVILVGDHKQLPAHGVDDETRADIIETLSEAGRKDEKWLKKTFNPTRLKEYKISLFEMIWKNVEGAFKHTLLINRRSRPVIARFVSALFYRGIIKTDPAKKDLEVEEDTLNIYDYTRNRPGVYYEDPSVAHRNFHEVNYVLDEIDVRLNQEKDGRPRYNPEDITIITPYKHQIELIRQALEAKAVINDIRSGVIPKAEALSRERLDILKALLKPGLNRGERADIIDLIDNGLAEVYGDRDNLLQALARITSYRVFQFDVTKKYGPRSVTWDGLKRLKLFEIETVDSIQGSENKVVILSLVRSNKKGNIGFMGTYDGIQRLTVAFSRAQEKLAIIGDFSNTLTKAKYEPDLKGLDADDRRMKLERMGTTEEARKIFINALRYSDSVKETIARFKKDSAGATLTEEKLLALLDRTPVRYEIPEGNGEGKVSDFRPVAPDKAPSRAMALVESIHDIASPISQSPEILLSRSLFDGLNIEDMSHIERIFRDTNIKIMDPKEIRIRAMNRKATPDKLAAVLTRNDFENKDVWNGADREYQIRSSVLIVDATLAGANYLYLEGILKLASAMMRNDRNAVRSLYSLLSGATLTDDVLDTLKDNPVTFAIKAILRFKPIAPMPADELDNCRKAMEKYLISA